MRKHSADDRWMRLALALGARGLGQTWPNPAVGCVIVKEGRVLGRGWTGKGGRPHAERVALAQAGNAAKGATAYVTLEPCAHTGKTTPCADALIDAGIARVVAACGDPDPRVAGKGFDQLHAAGIDLCKDVCKLEAEQAHIGFLTRVTQNRPAVTLKLANSLDGKIATSTGQSQWITGDASRAYVHFLRATHDAVMVGSGTSVADDPSLNVRLYGLENRKPVRIILDRNLSTPANSQLGRTAKDVPVWICHGSGAKRNDWDNTAATLVECAVESGTLSLTDTLSKLAKKGITRIFCEGGGKLAASLIRAGYVDRLITMTAGIAIGADGIPNLGALGIDALAQAPRFKFISQRQFGNDLMVEWHPT